MGSISVAMPVAVTPMSGIRTAAATVSDGVTTYDKAPKKPRGGIRNASWPDNPNGSPDCGCHWVDSGDGENYICPICGCTWNEYNEDGMEHCHCVAESGYCWCPLDMNWGAMVFLMLLAVGYGVRASMREKCTMKENENRA